MPRAPFLLLILTLALVTHSWSPALAQTSEAHSADYLVADQDLPKPEGPGVDPAETRKLIIEQTNAFREKQNLNPLKPNATLQKAAKKFAQYMARTHHYGHQADGQTPAQRAKAAGYDYCSIRENIAYQYDSRGFEKEALAESFVQEWIDSKGHRQNMLAPFATETGVAVVRSGKTGTYFAVQLIGRPESRSLTFRVSNMTRQPMEYRIEVNQPLSESRSFKLKPRLIRTHQRCLPGKVHFPDLERSVLLEDGLQLTIRPGQDGAPSLQVSQKK